jgi:hypothetical protein
MDRQRKIQRLSLQMSKVEDCVNDLLDEADITKADLLGICCGLARAVGELKPDEWKGIFDDREQYDDFSVEDIAVCMTRLCDIQTMISEGTDRVLGDDTEKKLGRIANQIRRLQNGK